MHVSWREYLNTPFEIVTDYTTVMEGEALAMAQAKKGKQTNTDAPAGFDMEAVSEVIEYRVPDAPKP